ncbi:MAG: heavy-metal-associated domain-containing protein [Pseudomonadota bacterium]
METIVLNVRGMSCGGCVSSIMNVLQAIDGVDGVDVSLERGQVTVRYDAGQVGVAAFKDAIEDAGYDVAG